MGLCLMVYTGNSTTTARMFQKMTWVSYILKTRSLAGLAWDNFECSMTPARKSTTSENLKKWTQVPKTEIEGKCWVILSCELDFSSFYSVHEDFKSVIKECYAPYAKNIEDQTPYGKMNGTA